MDGSPPKYEMAVGKGSLGENESSKDPSSTSFYPIIPSDCIIPTGTPSEAWNFPQPPQQFFAVPSGLSILDQAFSSLPNTIRIRDTDDRSQDEFFIRDVSDSLLFKADIDKDDYPRTILVSTLNGTPVLEIDCGVVDQDDRVFEVCHLERQIGSLTMTKKSVETFTIANEYENRNYFINYMSKMDIVISRDAYASPMAKIHLDWVSHPNVERSSRPWISFSGSIAFSDPTITTVEQSLIIGLAMAIMMVEKENHQHSEAVSSFYAYCCCLPVIIIIILLVGFGGRLFK